MYVVADDMVRLEFIAEMQISSYTTDDIEYMKELLKNPRGLIAEGAELTLYASCKYLIASIASEYQKVCLLEPISREIPKDIRMLFYGASRKLLPQIFNNCQSSDLEGYIALGLSTLYSNIIQKKMGITV